MVHLCMQTCNPDRFATTFSRDVAPTAPCGGQLKYVCDIPVRDSHTIQIGFWLAKEITASTNATMAQLVSFNPPNTAERG